MSDTPKRPWYQFSLRTLLVAGIVVPPLLAGLATLILRLQDHPALGFIIFILYILYLAAVVFIAVTIIRRTS